jgi:hypothetical protein
MGDLEDKEKLLHKDVLYTIWITPILKVFPYWTEIQIKLGALYFLTTLWISVKITWNFVYSLKLRNIEVGKNTWIFSHLKHKYLYVKYKYTDIFIMKVVNVHTQ